MSKNTVATYTSAYCRYLDFCHRSSHQAYPASENTLCQFAGFLGQQNLKHQQSNHTGTCQVFITIISCNQLFPEPCHAQVAVIYVLRGVRSVESKSARPVRKQLLITPAILCTNYFLRIHLTYAVVSSNIMLFQFSSIW